MPAKGGGHNDLVHQPSWDISECVSGLCPADGCRWVNVIQAADIPSRGRLGGGGAVLEETRFDMGGWFFPGRVDRCGVSL